MMDNLLGPVEKIMNQSIEVVRSSNTRFIDRSFLNKLYCYSKGPYDVLFESDGNTFLPILTGYELEKFLNDYYKTLNRSKSSRKGNLSSLHKRKHSVKDISPNDIKTFRKLLYSKRKSFVDDLKYNDTLEFVDDFCSKYVDYINRKRIRKTEITDENKDFMASVLHYGMYNDGLLSFFTNDKKIMNFFKAFFRAHYFGYEKYINDDDFKSLNIKGYHSNENMDNIINTFTTENIPRTTNLYSDIFPGS